MRITMIGSGYVGLVSGACLSDFGHDVICVDKDQSKIDALNAGRMPIYEPGLDQLVAANVQAGRLTFTTDLAAAVAGADAVFIAVGTPSRRGDGHADLSYVYGATREIAAAVTARPSSSPSRPCPSAPATRSSASCARSGRRSTWRSSPIPNSCARARRSATSSDPTASSSAPTTRAPAR